MRIDSTHTGQLAEQLIIMLGSRENILINRLEALTFTAKRPHILKMPPSPVQELMKT